MTAAQEFRMFRILLSIVRGEFMAKWWRKDSPEEDEMVSQASKTILEASSNADYVAKIELQTGKNLRDQLSVEEAERLQEEAFYKGFFRRN